MSQTPYFYSTRVPHTPRKAAYLARSLLLSFSLSHSLTLTFIPSQPLSLFPPGRHSFSLALPSQFTCAYPNVSLSRRSLPLVFNFSLFLPPLFLVQLGISILPLLIEKERGQQPFCVSDRMVESISFSLSSWSLSFPLYVLQLARSLARSRRGESG